VNEELRRGLERQLERLAQLEAAGERRGGWKVGLTSGHARNAMGPGFRPFGYLLASRIYHSAATIPLAALAGGAIENELCFTLGADLAGAPARRQVIGALATVAPAFEVAEERVPRSASAADRLADNLSQWGVVVGDSCSLDWAGFDFSALRVTLSRNGVPVEKVAAAGHIDDHFDSIAALVAQLHAFGLGLQQGDRVITGSYTRQGVEAPSRWMGDFGPAIGTVTLQFE
jgi:2-keto-4-pentenoate hydratase